jgi:ADP-heptose:LPS heptosyltransferase
MNLRTMRAVDYWVGVPLCFLSTFFTRLVGSPEAPPVPRRILFIELSEMGSTVIANPALEKARDEFDAEIFFLIFARNADSLKLLNTVPPSNVITIREGSIWTLAADSLRFLRWARRAKIDTVVDLELFSRFSALLTGFSGASRRVGFYRFNDEGLYRGEMLTHRVSYNSHMHMAKNFVAMINSLLSPVAEVPYSKTHVSDDEIQIPLRPVSEYEKEHARDLVREVYPGYQPDFHRIVLINPNGSELVPTRRWPQENFIEIAHRVVQEWDDTLVLITGSPSERPQALFMQGQIDHPRFRSLAGALKLSELPTLYAISEVLLTNDSGPAHFSAITPIRSIVLYGPETPKLYGSLGNSESITAELACSPCVSASNHRKSACNDPVCMSAITTDRVFASIRQVLDSERALRPKLVQLTATAARRN